MLKLSAQPQPTDYLAIAINVAPDQVGQQSASLADQDANKRTRLVDELLADQRFGQNFAHYWHDLFVKRDLEGRGHRFHTSSDTESIIHLYEDSGQACVKALRGMFGLAIWDQSRRTLLLARDRLGIKPLYYTEVGGRLAFASELKALLRLPGIRRDVDFEAVDAYLALQYIPRDRTGLAGIRRLLPGHVLIAEGESERIEPYWAPEIRPEPLGEDEWLERVRASRRHRAIIPYNRKNYG